jgi:arylsulfatase A-like enzyme
MPSSNSVPPAKALAEALWLGCSAGLLHAMVESTLLGWNGIRPSAVDLAILAAAAVGAGAALAAGVALAALVPPLRAVAARGPLAWRRAAWTMLAVGYLLVFLKIVSYSAGWGSALLWAVPAVPALGLACWAVFRKGQRALTVLCASALVATALCALQLFQADWSHEPASPRVFAARLLIPVGLCLLLLAAASKTTSPARPFESMTRGAGLLAVVAALWAGFWVNLDSDAPLQGFLDSVPAAASASSAAPSAASSTNAAGGARPNILLIVLDTVRADHLDLFGYRRETMPNLRRFALEQAQFHTRTFSTGSWTLPSHASMFTGLYPSAHGGHYPFVSDAKPEYLAYSIRSDATTLAEFLGRAGYQTAGIAANFGMLSQFGFERGFQQYTAAPGAAFFAPRLLWLYRAHWREWSPGEFLQRALPAGLQARSRMFSVREPDYRRAWEIDTLARQWLRRHGSRPFFLFLNFMDAHDPYLPPAEDDERFVKRPPGEEWLGFPTTRFFAAMRGEAKFSAEEIEFMQGQYDAGLVSLDRELGRLLDDLKRGGYFDNTLLLITSDHGEAFFEHGFPEHGSSLYQPEIDSFLVIKAPPSVGPIQASPRMQSVDLFPTIAALLHQPLPALLQGSAWGNGRDYALSEMFCKSCGAETTSAFAWPEALRRDLVAVTIGDYKLIRSTSGPDEVYDLSADPGERQPLRDPDPAFLRRAEEVIAERNKGLVKGLTEHPQDRKLIEKLRSLGYVQ